SLAGICTIVNTVLTCTTPETIELVLSTTSAHSFNFLVHNLSAGVYQVQLQIGVTTVATSNSLQAGATAMVGVGAGPLTNLRAQPKLPLKNTPLCGNTPNSASPPNGRGPCGFAKSQTFPGRRPAPRPACLSGALPGVL